jgi:hypothetical protein
MFSRAENAYACLRMYLYDSTNKNMSLSISIVALYSRSIVALYVVRGANKEAIIFR